MYWDNHLPSADQEILDWLVKIMILGEKETEFMLGIKSQFGDMSLAQVTPFQAYCLFF